MLAKGKLPNQFDLGVDEKARIEVTAVGTGLLAKANRDATEIVENSVFEAEAIGPEGNIVFVALGLSFPEEQSPRGKFEVKVSSPDGSVEFDAPVAFQPIGETFPFEMEYILEFTAKG